MKTVTAHLWFNSNCTEATEFYKKAFGAEAVGEVATGPGGNGVMHAMVKIGDSNVMMADAWPGQWERGPREEATTGRWLYVVDCDAAFGRAVDAGCEVMGEMANMFWGDRIGKLKDPFGHCWAIASHKELLTPEEMAQRREAWIKTLG
jgi:uncharacterized glyoxalase superfamily protein PhnB